MRKKVHSYLGFAVKAGKVIMGYNQCEMAIYRNKLKLIIVTNDVAENTKKKFEKIAKECKVPIYIYSNSDEISLFCGSEMKNVFGITDKQFALIIEKEIQKEINETGGVLIDK
jgi:ribosomal protein L7Ae-like RNA K-turn-binding protein